PPVSTHRDGGSALAEATDVALLAAFLVHEAVAAAVGAEVAGDGEAVEQGDAGRWRAGFGRGSAAGGGVTVAVAGAVAGVAVPIAVAVRGLAKVHRQRL